MTSRQFKCTARILVRISILCNKSKTDDRVNFYQLSYQTIVLMKFPRPAIENCYLRPKCPYLFMHDGRRRSQLRGLLCAPLCQELGLITEQGLLKSRRMQTKRLIVSSILNARTFSLQYCRSKETTVYGLISSLIIEYVYITFTAQVFLKYHRATYCPTYFLI